MVGAPRGSRLLKGLDVTNIVYHNAANTTEIHNGSDATTERQPVSGGRRSLREKKDNISYDMRFHPGMDPVIRPKAKATLRNRGKSMDLQVQGEASEPEWDSQSSSLSGKSGDDSNSDEEDESDESEDGETEDRHRYPFVLTPRALDPRATRHSSRSAARQPINYSTKHHPQDHSLPGYRHKAVAHRKMLVPMVPHLKATKRKIVPPTPDSDDGQHGVHHRDDSELEEEREEHEDQRPRKQLRSLEQDTSSSLRPAKIAAAAKVAAKPFKQTSITLPDSEIEIDDLVNEAIRASQLPGQISFGEDIDQLVEEAVRATNLLTKSTRAEPIEVSSSTSSSDDEEEEEDVSRIHDDQQREESTSLTEGREEHGFNAPNQEPSDDSMNQPHGDEFSSDQQLGCVDSYQQSQFDPYIRRRPRNLLESTQSEDGLGLANGNPRHVDEQPEDEPSSDQQVGTGNQDQNLPGYPNSDEQLRGLPDSDEPENDLDSEQRPRDTAVEDEDREPGHVIGEGNDEQHHESEFDAQFAVTLGARDSEKSSNCIPASDPLVWMSDYQ